MSTPKIEMAGVTKAFGTTVCCAASISSCAGREPRDHRRLGHGQVRDAQMRARARRAGCGRDPRRAGCARLRGRRERLLFDKFGMLFQGGALFDSPDGLAERRLPPAARTAQALGGRRARRHREAAPRRPDPGQADLFPAELSGGMQKRVGLARAIAAEPEIIFFDEPTTGLDPIMADVINDLIREIVEELGATAVTITHDMTACARIAHRVAMIHDGLIQWEGRSSDRRQRQPLCRPVHPRPRRGPHRSGALSAAGASAPEAVDRAARRAARGRLASLRRPGVLLAPREAAGRDARRGRATRGAAAHRADFKRRARPVVRLASSAQLRLRGGPARKWSSPGDPDIAGCESRRGPRLESQVGSGIEERCAGCRRRMRRPRLARRRGVMGRCHANGRADGACGASAIGRMPGSPPGPARRIRAVEPGRPSRWRR